VGRLRASVENLNRRGIPLAFAFVYDEFWQAFQSISPVIEAALGPGYKAMPDFWVWCVVPSETSVGWGPHRDKVAPTLDRDNSPHTLTVWLPFSDATPLNGCIYMLPAHLDERFKRRNWGGEGNNVVPNPQDVRALPASAGSVLAWNQAVLHWGGRASRQAEAARVSAAFEFQRGDKPAFNNPLLDPKKTPAFRQRLGLIAKQVLQYKHMYPLSEDVAKLAETLRDRFMPGAALRF
jgi:ectoine hydroxylase-related dioxygenase (phytanoyl-CoA dioxygenase family)